MTISHSGYIFVNGNKIFIDEIILREGCIADEIEKNGKTSKEIYELSQTDACINNLFALRRAGLSLANAYKSIECYYENHSIYQNYHDQGRVSLKEKEDLLVIFNNKCDSSEIIYNNSKNCIEKLENVLNIEKRLYKDALNRIEQFDIGQQHMIKDLTFCKHELSIEKIEAQNYENVLEEQNDHIHLLEGQLRKLELEETQLHIQHLGEVSELKIHHFEELQKEYEKHLNLDDSDDENN